MSGTLPLQPCIPFLSVRFVNLVCLPEAVPVPAEGRKCWITGWGRSHSVGGSSPNVLQQASVPIVGRNRCEWVYLGRIHDSMLCAGLDRGGIDSCQGDSGGPIVGDRWCARMAGSIIFRG